LAVFGISSAGAVASNIACTAYEFARTEPAYYSAMFEGGIRSK
jgi:hypothetical protein